METLILLCLFMFLLPIIQAAYNYYILQGKKNLWHILGGLQYGLIVVMVVYLLLDKSISLHYNSIWDFIKIVCVMLSWRWVFFDLTMNKLLNQEWWYVGSGNIDLFFKKYFKINYTLVLNVVKYSVFLFSCYILIKMFKLL